VGQTELRWDPVIFSYGPVKGTASLSWPIGCAPAQKCAPTFDVQFGDLDAGILQAAFLGAHEPGAGLSTLIARLGPSDAAPAWPQLEGTVEVQSLILGPVKLRGAKAALHILSSGAEIQDLDAELLGGHVHGGGTLTTATGPDKPRYSLQGHFDKLSASAVGELLGESWSGQSFDADGKIELSGFTDTDLASSAKGSLHFVWQRGSMKAGSDAGASTAFPGVLAHFNRWTADAEIANGTITLKQNEVQQGNRKSAIEGSVTLGAPAKIGFAAPRYTTEKR